MAEFLDSNPTPNGSNKSSSPPVKRQRKVSIPELKGIFLLSELYFKWGDALCKDRYRMPEEISKYKLMGHDLAFGDSIIITIIHILLLLVKSVYISLNLYYLVYMWLMHVQSQYFVYITVYIHVFMHRYSSCKVQSRWAM